MKQMENEMIVSVPLEVVKASEIEPREVKWLWYAVIKACIYGGSKRFSFRKAADS